MITLSNLENLIHQSKLNKTTYKFQADAYVIEIDYLDKIYIIANIENLENYTQKDRNHKLNQYIQRNSNAIGYIYSTLAYSKNHNVIVQRWLSISSNINQTMQALKDILQHADILTNTI